MSDERQTLTVEEAAKVLGIGRSLAYEACRENRIPNIRVGDRILVPADVIQRMLETGAVVKEGEE